MPGRHVWEIHSFDGCQLPTGHPGLHSAASTLSGRATRGRTPTRYRRGGGWAHLGVRGAGFARSDRPGASALCRFDGDAVAGRSPCGAGHLPDPWFQLPRRGAQCCPLSGPGLLPVGVPPHLDGQLQQAAAKGCRPLPVGRIGKASVGPFPGMLRGDQVLGESRATHISYCIMCSISCASLQLSGSLSLAWHSSRPPPRSGLGACGG